MSTERTPGKPFLCLVTDRAACRGRALQDVVAAAVRSGVSMVQLREKELSARELLRLGRDLQGPVQSGGARLIVNDRVDVALALGADGVHLGSGALPVGEARRIVPGGMLVGASVHSLDEALIAEAEGADYLLLGTIFETPSHPGCSPAGVELVARVTSSVRVPVVAIGGINAGNAASVVEAGAAGIALLRAIQSAPDVEAATESLLRSIGRGNRFDDSSRQRS